MAEGNANESEFLKKRLLELAQRAYAGGFYTYMGFLSMAEQALLQSLHKQLALPASLWGGAEGCERRMARFGEERLCGDAGAWPLSCLLARPRSAKFADDLTHRDFLGALMNLGLERNTLGDIVQRENAAYVFCTAAVAPIIMEELTQVKHTNVSVTQVDALPEGALYALREELVQAASARADAVVARAYGLSREESLALFSQKRVFLNAAICENNSRALAEGDVVSVRGYGRFVYRGVARVSKKGKLNIRIEKYEGVRK